MRKVLGVVCVSLGAALVLGALLLFGYNQKESMDAGRASEQALASVREAVRDRGAAPGALDPNMPTVEIDGYAYVGYLSVPSVELELPVMAEWDYDRLKIAPCRQFGSSRTDDLVIAAHNYTSHFGKLSGASVGDAVTFTDMEGVVNAYAVAAVETVDPTLVENVERSGYPLVLYTCTYSGETRSALFCKRM